MIEYIENDDSKACEERWYVVYTKARLEAIAREHLTRQRFDTYLPLVETPKRKKGQITSIVSPFFPRYLFVRLKLASDNWAPIRSTRGVCGLVKFNGVPKPVPDEFVTMLKSNENAEHLQSVLLPEWQSGDEITIEQGPFSGYRCIFQQRRSADRVAVLLNIIGKPTQATLNYQDLQLPQFA